jgi:hypothetical protein
MLRIVPQRANVKVRSTCVPRRILAMFFFRIQTDFFRLDPTYRPTPAAVAFLHPTFAIAKSGVNSPVYR